ncbi:MAG: hypothetical protein C4323_21200 [Mastigocladus sp. ERB_26_2]
MNLSSKLRKGLQEALINAFPTKAFLEQMLSFELDKNLEAVAGEGNLETVVFNLIKRAESEGWVGKLVRAARKQNPGNLLLQAIARELLINTYHKEKEAEQQAVKLNYNDTGYYNRRGMSHYNLGEYQAAIEDFNQAIKINPNIANYYYNRGLSHYNLSEYQAAIEDLNQAIKLNNNDGDYYYYRGWSRYNLDEYQAAIEDLNQAIKLKPNVANYYNRRGMSHYNLGEYQAAIEDYNQAIILNPNVDTYITTIVVGLFTI